MAGLLCNARHRFPSSPTPHLWFQLRWIDSACSLPGQTLRWGTRELSPAVSALAPRWWWGVPHTPEADSMVSAAGTGWPGGPDPLRLFRYP